MSGFNSNNEQSIKQAEWIHLIDLKKDVCFLFHELSGYGGFMGDLDYDLLFNYKYWDFFHAYPDYTDMNDLEFYTFLRDGCLIMILNMCWDVIDDSGTYVLKYTGEIRKAVDRLVLDSENSLRLIEAVQKALDCAGTDIPEETLQSESVWVYETYIDSYFRSRIGGQDSS